MSRNNKAQGFTIIELMLSMVFVSFILIFMALTLVQILRIYDKSVSMKQINQAGRSITEEIARSMRSQLPSSIQLDNVGNGVLCIDKTMYYWTPLYQGDTALSSANVNTNFNAITGPPTTGGNMVRKTLINANTDCTADEAADASNFEPGSEAILLSSRSRVLWANVTRNTDQRLVKLSFIIGTYDRNEVDTAGERSLLNNGPYTNFEITPHRERTGTNANITCLPGSSGNFCSFAEFSTVVYLSKDQL